MSDNGFLKPCLCSRDFLEVYALESRLEISCEINVFQHCLTLFRLCTLGHGVTMHFSLMCPVGHTVKSALSESALAPSFPRFSGLELATFLCPEVSACFQQYQAGGRPNDRSQGT